jgi:putative hemolysin
MTASFDGVMVEVRGEGHSCVPTYDANLDDIKGFFHTKDLMTVDIDPKQFRLRDHLWLAEFVPEMGHVSDLLRTFQPRRTHLAVVVDEFGVSPAASWRFKLCSKKSSAQFKKSTTKKKHRSNVSTIRAGSLRGRVSLYELAELLGPTFPDGGYEALGGFSIARTGRMPRTGDRLGF